MLTSLVFPTSERIKSLLSNNEISFGQAVTWLVVASLSYAALMQSAPLFQEYSPTAQKIYGLVGHIISATLISLAGDFLYCGFVYFVAKLFKSKAMFQSHFIGFSFFNSPLILLCGILLFFWSAFQTPIGLFGGAIIGLYLLLWINTIIIKAVYDFPWAGTIFLNVSAIALIALLTYIIPV